MLQWLVGKQIDLIGQTLAHFQEQEADQQDVAFQEAVAARSRASEALRKSDFDEAIRACIHAQLCLALVSKEIENDARLKKAINAILDRAE